MVGWSPRMYDRCDAVCAGADEIVLCGCVRRAGRVIARDACPLASTSFFFGVPGISTTQHTHEGIGFGLECAVCVTSSLLVAIISLIIASGHQSLVVVPRGTTAAHQRQAADDILRSCASREIGPHSHAMRHAHTNFSIFQLSPMHRSVFNKRLATTGLLSIDRCQAPVQDGTKQVCALFGTHAMPPGTGGKGLEHQAGHDGNTCLINIVVLGAAEGQSGHFRRAILELGHRRRRAVCRTQTTHLTTSYNETQVHRALARVRARLSIDF